MIEKKIAALLVDQAATSEQNSKALTTDSIPTEADSVKVFTDEVRKNFIYKYRPISEYTDEEFAVLKTSILGKSGGASHE